MSKKTKTVRELALDILESVSKNQSYSNLQLHTTIEDNNLSPRDVGLLTELTYGTLQRQITLDYQLQPFIKGKLDQWVRELLRLTLYQLIYLDKIPDHAAIYEAVEIAKKRGHRGISGLVNGVLRSFLRKGPRSFDEITDPVERLAIETSHPLWLVQHWVTDFGFQQTKAMCEENHLVPTQTARVNIEKIRRDSCIDKLLAEGFAVEASSVIPDSVRALKGNLAHSTCYQEGLLTIQDESSMLVGYVIDPQKGERILDACAAPGGKTTHIAEKLQGTGQVVALDIHPHKAKLIEAQAERLELQQIETTVTDARDVARHYEEGSFDRVLLDAPCTGLGVIRRKPDVKYTKSAQDIVNLQKVQLDLLKQVAKMVKDRGLLVYSTCTVNKQENIDVITTFLKENDSFVLDSTCKDRLPEGVRPFMKDGMLQIFPQDFGSDGFFIACLRKKV